ncbi:uncharacterized protein [Leptinotarsa decemlineata]|uniref:uncharacterized protein n=1 Tax=Leptinotarsa decemlineata TaxID=7539 RepID=UPI003D305587
MFGCKLTHTIILSILTNLIICDLLKEGNEDAKNTDKIDASTKPLYEKYPGNIHYSPYISHLHPSFMTDQNGLTKPPVLLSLGLGDFAGFKELVLPSNFPTSQENHNEGSALFFKNPSHLPSHLPQIQEGRYRQGPLSHQNFYSGGDRGFSNWMRSRYPLGVGFDGFENLRFPIQFLVPEPPEIRYTGPVLSSEMKTPTLDLLDHSPDIEILKSISYSLPPDITTYFPTTYDKDYFIDIPSPSTQKPKSYESQSLLLGELEDNKEGKEKEDEEHRVTNYGFESPSDEDDSAGKYEVSTPGQYYYTNRRPITFEQSIRKPKNIYDIISAEKIVPKEMDMTVHIGRHHRLNTSWKPIMAHGNMAEGSDAVAVKSEEHENVTVEDNDAAGKDNSAEKHIQDDLEVFLTGEEIIEREKYPHSASELEKDGEGTEKKDLVMLTGEKMETSDNLKTVEKISVVSDVISVTDSAAVD